MNHAVEPVRTPGTRVEGVVSRIEGSIAVVDVATQKGCGRCDEPGGCGGGLAAGGPACSRSYQLPNKLGVKPGDAVILTVPSGTLLRAAAWAYGLPLVLGLLGAFLGAATQPGDGAAVVGGLAGMVLGFILLRLLARGQASASAISMEVKPPAA